MPKVIIILCRFGRLSEGFSEEPTLSSAYARAAVAGLQGDNGGRPLTYLDNKHILSLAKHYAAYGSEAGGLNAAPAQISERTLREIYLKVMSSILVSVSAFLLVDCLSSHGKHLLSLVVVE